MSDSFIVYGGLFFMFVFVTTYYLDIKTRLEKIRKMMGEWE